MSHFFPSTEMNDKSPVSTSEHSPSPTPNYIPGCFEGPEKTMEVCFIPGIGDEEGLRKLSRKQLDCLCTEAKCSILSQISSAYMDAYVLSESSLFIYKHRYIMKTCGTTTLLHCLDSLLRFADDLKMELMWVGYSRKNLLFPTQQAWPHSNFGDEIEYLNSHKLLQDRLNGVAHILGPVTGDHWFVYVADNPPHMATLLDSYQKVQRDENIFHTLEGTEENQSKKTWDPSSAGYNIDLTSSMMTMEGVTVNMMMFDLNPVVCKMFYQPDDSKYDYNNMPSDVAADVGKSMTKAAGIDHLVPGATIDETSFSPCGYSMNAILHDAYSTIHVTPETECSYASFETNTNLRAYSPLVRNVLNVFEPKRFVLTMFADEVAYNILEEAPTSSREFFVPKVGMYLRTNLSSTNIGTDLHCMMACFTLVSNESSPLQGFSCLDIKVNDSIRATGFNLNPDDPGTSLSDVPRRVRGNSVDLISEVKCKQPTVTLQDHSLVV